MKPLQDRIPRIARREYFIQALFALLLLVPAYPGVFLHGHQISATDILYELPPWSHYAPEGFEHAYNGLMFDPIMAFRPDFCLVQDALRNGEWPLWNPLEMGGMPLLANAQSTVFYPPRLLLTCLDVDTCMTLFVLLKLWFCAFTAYICGRFLGFTIWGARFFSVAWMLGGFCLIWSNWPEPDVAGWVPVVFIGLEFLLAGRYRRGFFTLCLGTTGLLIAGHPEVAFALALGLGYYFLTRLVVDRRWGTRLWAPLGLAAAGWIVGLLIYAPQLFTFIEYLANSFTFSERDKMLDDVALPAGTFITFWIPRFFGTFAEKTFWDTGKWNSNLCSQQYVGIAVWVGIAALLARKGAAPRPTAERARITSLWVSVIICVMLAFNLRTLRRVHELPVFSSMHEIYHIYFALFALPILGTIGLERWFSRPRRIRETLWQLLLLLPVAALTVFLLRFCRRLMGILQVTDYVHHEIGIAALFAGAAFVLLVTSCLVYRPRLLMAAFTVFLAVDLLLAVRGLNPTMPDALICPDTALTRFMQSQEQPCRFGIAEGGVVNGTMCNYGIEEWLGYDGLLAERVKRFQTELGSTVWRNMARVQGIRYYLNDPLYPPGFPLEEQKQSGRFELVAVLDGLEVYKNRDAFPRAFLARGIEVIADRKALFNRMKSSDYDPVRTVLVQERPQGTIPQATAPDLGSAHVIEHRATRVTIDLDAAEAAVLVLADACYPGWEASVDSTPAEIFPAYYAFRGVIVPPGKHMVTFTYRPMSLRAGLAVGFAALAAGSVAAVRALRKTARPPQPHPAG